MKRLLHDIGAFCCCKVYVAGLLLVAVCAYGYAVTHYAIGMDDTAIPLYFEEGLAPYVGRWSMFLLNKIIPITDFAPWVVESASVAILMLSVTLWCVLWKRICEPAVVIPIWSYVFVAGIFLSCPLISEIFVFYLHNGICLGYGVIALALLCFMDSLAEKKEGMYCVGQLALSVVLLAIALGFYESLLIVYVMGAIMCFFLIRRFYGKESAGAAYSGRLFLWAVRGTLTVLAGIAGYKAVAVILKAAYHLDRLACYNVLYRRLFGEMFMAEGELQMVLKRFFMRYYVNAVVYLPIAVLVTAWLFIGVYALCVCVRQKDILLLVCAVILAALPVSMSLAEGYATRYRSAQYVPVVSAFAVFGVIVELYLRRHLKWLPVLGVMIGGIIVVFQCADMTRWFQVDYLKYRDTKEVMDRVAHDLEAGYDISKPIVFRGAYTVPYEICKAAYVSFSSGQYRLIGRLTDWLDPHLKEKYFGQSGRGYVFTENPIVSTLQWGVTAFDGTSGQLIEFWKMHGYDAFYCETNLDVIAEAERIHIEDRMPGYPDEGYIKEYEKYIIVNFAATE